MKNSKKIAILATGDEITQGTILNTNGQTIAHQLSSHGIDIQWHMAVADDEKDITEALHVLAKHHDIIITIGGLGPTSDDKTRFALAKFLNAPLEMHQPSFESLSERYSALNMPFTKLSQQQALFPKNSTILQNLNGSANACFVSEKLPWIFMLPGPPRECLPLFETEVLPLLIQHCSANQELLQWKVFGVAEGMIAAQVDNALKSYVDCRTGFRWNYPYVDCKVLLPTNHPQKSEIIQLLDALLAPYQLNRHNKRATDALKEALTHLKSSECITIADTATGGVLESQIHTPRTHAHIRFVAPEYQPQPTIVITGLLEYWQQEETQTTTLSVRIANQTQTFDIPMRKTRLEEYASELAAHHILQIL